MLAFAIAHLLYVSAFGFKPLRPILGALLFTSSAPMIYFYFNIIEDVILKYGVSVYTILLFTMGWRALSRVKNSQSELFALLGIDIKFRQYLYCFE
jgi:uncharacterized membrane protein YhhN